MSEPTVVVIATPVDMYEVSEQLERNGMADLVSDTGDVVRIIDPARDE